MHYLMNFVNCVFCGLRLMIWVPLVTSVVLLRESQRQLTTLILITHNSVKNIYSSYQTKSKYPLSTTVNLVLLISN